MAVLWLHELVNSRIICLIRLLNTYLLNEVHYILRYLWDVSETKIDVSDKRFHCLQNQYKFVEII